MREPIRRDGANDLPVNAAIRIPGRRGDSDDGVLGCWPTGETARVR